MKFVCDRCKTRYSIGDDRVRGKILKIRCKNCANVITVREGMTVEEPDPRQRTQRPTTLAPAAAHTASANGSAKPPAALDEEWYVSIDGDQSGPYSLAEAQRWIAGKAFDAELHCWSEGFDDWLPVDKVSHFRGLRKKPAPPPVPRQQQHRSTAQPVVAAPRVEEEPKPLFTATMAALEKSAEARHDTPRPVAKAKATPSGGMPAVGRTNGSTPVPRTDGFTSRNGSGPSPAASSPSGPTAIPGTNGKTLHGSVPTPAVRTPSGPNPATNGPSAARTAGALPAPFGSNPPSVAKNQSGPQPAMLDRQSGPQPAIPDRQSGPQPALKPGLGSGPATALKGGSGPATALKPATRTPTTPGVAGKPIPGFDVADVPEVPDAGEAATAIGAPAYVDPVPEPTSAPISEPHEAGATVPQDFAARPKGDDDEDDMDIGEVSRVVKLADLARPAPRAQPARRPSAGRLSGTNAAVGRNTGSVARVGGGTAPVNRISAPAIADGGMPVGPGAELQPMDPMLAPSSEIAMMDPSVIPPPPEVTHRRGMIVLLVVALLLVGSAAAVVVYIVQNGDDSQVQIGGNNGPGVDTGRPEDRNPNPIFPQPTPGSDKQPDKHPAGNGNPTYHPHPNGSNTKPPDDNTKPTSDKPLDPGEVETMANAGQFLTTRCWNLALKKQPFLSQDVKRLTVMLAVDSGGGVSMASVSGLPKDDGGLGGCLNTVIHGWHARPNKGGGNFQITLAFQ